MALFDFLDSHKRFARKVEKAVKKVTNPYVQPEERMAQAEFLQATGSKAAIYGLLRRFSIRASNLVIDEDEKRQVYALIVDLGPAAVEPILRFIRREDQILYPLKALAVIESTEAFLGHLKLALDELGPEYMKLPERKLHLVQHLASLDDPRVVEILAPFVEEHDETIRFQVIQALAERGGEVANEAILSRLLTDEDESLRIQNAICEALSKAQFSVGEARQEEVSDAVPEKWVVDEQGRIQKR